MKGIYRDKKMFEELETTLNKDKRIIKELKQANKDLKEDNDKSDGINRCECGSILIEQDGLFYCNECGKEYFRCNQCEEILPEEELGESELAKTDMICKNCMEDGYGE